MSLYNPIYQAIWSDSHFEEYSAEKKLVFIFLLTNQFTNKSGIYKISLRQISFSTNLERNIINEFINELINESKIRYDFDKSIIFIKNFYKYQKGMIKNSKVMLATLEKNYNLTNTVFWDEFFDIYKNDKTINYLINETINKPLMIHQSSINKDNNISINKDKDINKEDDREKKSKEFTELKKNFTIIYKLFNKEKNIKVIPFDKLKVRFQNCLAEISFEELQANVLNYLDYLKVANWRKKKDFAAWINSSELFANDWLADTRQEEKNIKNNNKNRTPKDPNLF